MTRLTARLVVLILTASLLTGCATTGEFSADRVYHITGTTRFMGHALSEGIVTASRGAPGGEEVVSPIGADGSFVLAVRRGVYYLYGRSRDPETGDALWSYWGGNPINVFGDIPATLVLPFTRASDPPAVLDGAGIRGVATLEGTPVEGVRVAAYLDPEDGFHGPPYSLSPPSDGQGRYHIPVEPGTYYLVARKRSPEGAFLGPLRKGDLLGYFPYNPVTVRQKRGLDVQMALVEVNRPRGEGSLAPGESITLTGTIDDEAGLPIEGARALLFNDPEMLGRPAFVSSPSDSEGRYILEVSREGIFYLAARSMIGGPPETGQLLGYYSGSQDRSVTLRWGDRLVDLNIKVREVW